MAEPDELDYEERIKKALAFIKSGYGDDAANRGDEEPPVGHITTGSLELDYATGGGIPIGRWSRLYGGPSAGKSTLTMEIIANAQKMGLVCAYYNAEKSFEKSYAQKRGVNTNDLVLIQSSVIEDIGEIAEATMDTIDLHVIDSCSACVSRVELVDGLNEKEYIGIRVRKWNQQFSFMHERFNQKRNAVIYVDQIRVKGMMQGFSTTGPPGGLMMEHQSSMTIELRRGDWLWYDQDGILKDVRNTKQKSLSGMTEADGIEFKAKVVKSKICRPFRQASILYDLNKLDYDHIDEYVRAAKYFGIVDVSGGWIKLKDSDESIRPKQLRAMIEEDDDFKVKIKQSMMESE